MKDKKFIQKAIKKPGALHKALHVSMDKKIPEAKLEKVKHSKLKSFEYYDITMMS